MAAKDIVPLLKKLDVQMIDFDDLTPED